MEASLWHVSNPKEPVLAAVGAIDIKARQDRADAIIAQRTNCSYVINAAVSRPGWAVKQVRVGLASW